MLTMNTTSELNWWYHKYVEFLPDTDSQETPKEVMIRHQKILDKLTESGMPLSVRCLLDDYICQIMDGKQ